MNRISELIYKSLVGRLTEDDKNTLDEWLRSSGANRELYDRLTNPAHLDQERRLWSLVDTGRARQDMTARIRQLERSHRMWKFGAAAAVLLLIATAATWFGILDNRRDGIDKQPVAQSLAPATIQPGQTHAVLTVDNGKTFTLDTNFTAASYPSQAKNLPATAAKKIRNLSLDVPRGAEFKVVLEDSTEVWLNSASTLHYPEHFNGAERRVAVVGEAYFKVKRDEDHPFIVESGGQQLRVCGTEFNVRFYPDEGCVYTTLASGSVAITDSRKANGEVYLTPGHQAEFKPDRSTLTVQEVDTDQVTGWRHGRFVFENQSLGRIMADLSRWYNFTYSFSEPELADIVFMGSVPRYADFATAVTILQNSGGIHFDINGLEVNVSRNSNN